MLDDEVIPLPTAMRLLHCSREALWQKIRTGTLHAITRPTGRTVRHYFSRREILRYQAWRQAGQIGCPPQCPEDLTLHQAAQAKHVTYATITNWITAGKLPAHLHGNRQYVRRPDLAGPSPWRRVTTPKE